MTNVSCHRWRGYRAIVVLAVALALLLSLLDVAPGRHTRVVQASGLLTESINSSVSVSATLTGLDQTVDYSLGLTVTNLLGLGASWDLTITSTQFTTGGGAPHTLPTTTSSVTGVSAVCTTLCVNPSNTTTYPVALPAGATPPPAVSFFHADTNTGSGTFTITATVAVVIPANAYAGVYTSTLTVNIISN